MKYVGGTCLFLGSFLFATSSSAEMINQVPENLLCTVNGTGSGMCYIIFPSGTITSCPNDTQVIFDPESGILAKQTYSIVLTAIATNKPLEISLLPDCHPLGRAMIDWIKL